MAVGDPRLPPALGNGVFPTAHWGDGEASMQNATCNRAEHSLTRMRTGRGANDSKSIQIKPTHLQHLNTMRTQDASWRMVRVIFI